MICGVGYNVLTSRIKNPPLVAWVTTHPGSHFSGLAPRWFVRLRTHTHIHTDTHTDTHTQRHTQEGEVEEGKGRERTVRQPQLTHLVAPVHRGMCSSNSLLEACHHHVSGRVGNDQSLLRPPVHIDWHTVRAWYKDREIH